MIRLPRSWWRARSRTAKALFLAGAALLLVLGVRFDRELEPRPAAAEPVAAEPAETQAAPLPPAEAREPDRSDADAAGDETDVVARVIDGDTIALASGTVVRLVQIDAPEVRGSECYAQRATAALEGLVPAGTSVTIEADPGLDQVDRYGRRLGYVRSGGENVNLALVRQGAASVWFYRGARGRYADELLVAAEEAQAAGRGLWGACDAVLHPLAAVSTAPRTESGEAPSNPATTPAPAAVGEAGEACHPAYEPCLPVVDDLNCSAVRALGRAPVTVKVRGVDPYHLDGDRDGVGCQ